MTLLAERCGSVEVAEQTLVRGLKGVGRVPVPWSHMREDGSRVAGDTAFWNSLHLTIKGLTQKECADITRLAGGMEKLNPIPDMDCIELLRNYVDWT